MLARVYAIANPSEAEDPAYVEGLRRAVRAAVDYGLAALDDVQGEVPVPSALLVQARHAARSGISLDTVLRRYFAGYTLLGDFILQEAEHDATISAGALKQVMRRQAILFNRLLTAVAEQHGNASRRDRRGRRDREAALVRMLLEGELLEADELDYDLSFWHLAAIGRGPGAQRALRDLAASLERRVLIVAGGEEDAWAWFGGREKPSASRALAVAKSDYPEGLALAIGEAGQGTSGWRRSHRQAMAAMPVALNGAPQQVRYGDVALLASALADEVLAETLRDTYLAPLERDRDEGVRARRILRAYLAAACNVSAAAAALGLSRKTVGLRLRAIEEMLDRPIENCVPELHTALRLEEIASPWVGEG